jgi:hypothetical protein
MVYNTQNYWGSDFFHCPILYKVKNTTFRELFPKRRVFYFVEYGRLKKSENPIILNDKMLNARH